MSERDRMEAGELYRFEGDAELMALGVRSRRLTRRYNATREDEEELRRELLEELFGSMGEGARVEPPLHCDYGFNIHAGARFFANYGLIVLDECRVSIGDDVMIGPRVSLCCAGHPIDAGVRASGLEYGKPISIGNNVWIGAHTVVNPGVTIGDNTVIGSGSVVTKDVPANVVAAGNPCRVLRSITAEDAARWKAARDAYLAAVAAEVEEGR
ncbi:maltose acetyltransferase [Gordonibacter sp. An230]|uniref:sugar O-acetyltransferase n=1 Tax=Gordonibacter sp. An230 TaxID=1965592 RepID=UPI000B3A82CC|nr:maltose acetyltransferase [Gordonibacter sp. An230]